MPRRILIVQGHPDPDRGRLCRALADAYAEGAREAGHPLERIDLAGMRFPLLRSVAEFERGIVPDALASACDAIRAADHIVLVFPLWLGTMPALVKAFLEHVMRPGIAFAPGQGGPPGKLLTGKSARLIVTMGMPAPAYRWWHRAHGIVGLKRNILGLAGIRPVRTTVMGGVESASAATVRQWLARAQAQGAAAE